ncbi:MAG: helix-hairpin-helix domain-containing protein [Geminicoccaceae bacterium]
MNTIFFLIGIATGSFLAWWWFQRWHKQQQDAFQQDCDQRVETLRRELGVAGAHGGPLVAAPEITPSQEPAPTPAPTPNPELGLVGTVPNSSPGLAESSAPRDYEATLPPTDADADDDEAPVDEAPAQSAPIPPSANGSATTETAAEVSSEPDDLKKIKGIGPVLEKKLHNLGITTFAQIAAFDATEIARIDEVLDFMGRFERE